MKPPNESPLTNTTPHSPRQHSADNMKADTFLHMNPGDRLTLKPAMHAAYGYSSPVVTFQSVSPRAGYSVPNIVATMENGKPGVFKPSDFNKWEAA